jgi:hypothetical protein
MLKEGKAKVVKRNPFTIQLLYESTHYKQPVTLGLDSGYAKVGFSAVSVGKELIAGEVTLLEGQAARNEERRKYRRQRRNRKRHRAPRFDNRRKPEGWLAPSIQHKLDSHIRLVEKIRAILPITEIVVEVAAFDIQAIKNPDIEGKEYQQGEQAGFWNFREYILHRDGHKCQNPECENRAKEQVLQVHHVGFWKDDRTDRPGNLITLCDKCHRPENHKLGGFLWGWEPKVQSFRAETFMTIVRWRLVNQLGCRHTYGYVTKSRRIAMGLEKNHANDAFCIAGGTDQERITSLTLEQVRRNDRSLQKFYDAKYMDTRTGEVVSGQDLNCGRRTRNKNLNTENLRKYRCSKNSKGRISVRKGRYPFRPKDTVLYGGKEYLVKGVQNKGVYVKLAGLDQPVKTNAVTIRRYGRGFRVV